LDSISELLDSAPQACAEHLTRVQQTPYNQRLTMLNTNNAEPLPRHPSVMQYAIS